MERNKRIKALRRTALVIGAASFVAVLTTGCIFSPPENKPPGAPPVMDSPADVLKNVEIAYNQRNIRYYKRALSDAFVFYFDPDDVGQNPPGSNYVIPETWSYTEDWTATETMFEKAYSISLSIPTGGVGEPDPEATTYKANNISITLLVMIDEINGYIANQGYCNFQFEKYQDENGDYLWRLTKWWDNTNV